MDLKHYFVQISDFYFRFRNRLRKKLRNISEFSSDSNLSDSQVSFYIDNIREILKSEDKLERFRRSYDYREILEHVNYKLETSTSNKSKSNYQKVGKERY